MVQAAAPLKPPSQREMLHPLKAFCRASDYTLKLLAKLHLTRVVDLVFHLPTSVKAYPLTSLKTMPLGKDISLEVKVVSYPGGGRKEQRSVRVLCEDLRNPEGALRLIDLVFFHRTQGVHQRFTIGSTWVISGKVEAYQGRFQMVHPEQTVPLAYKAGFSPYQVIYPLTTGLSRRTLVGLIQKALKALPSLPEWLPETLLRERGWPTWKDAMARLHAVTCEGDLAPTLSHRQRLAFDELLAEQLILLLARRAAEGETSVAFLPKETLRHHILKAFGHPLTGSQTQALADMDGDLKQAKPMGRLLHGDVGSGKTIVAFAAMAPILEAGFQVAMLVPTEILAHQQARQCEALLEGTDLKVACLTSSTRRKADLYQCIQAGEFQVIIGTHALLEEGVQFQQLGMVVIDEQHRFGVSQRLKLTQKGLSPHVLVMSATPIPRTFELTRYGDLEISRLDEKPAGRLPVKTLLFGPKKKPEVLESIAKLIEGGGSGYWVCPLVEATETNPLMDVTSRFEHLSARFPGQVGLLHGQLKAEEKAAVIEAFRRGDLRLLVATTVIEVGVNVPQATLMVVEHAERFGLAQLHQLRGRVGRGTEASYCFLLYNYPLSEEGQARLNILRQSQDGFWIAEQDWLLRGGGDHLGTRQSGLPFYRLADLVAHHNLLPQARALATEILKEDPLLQSPKGKAFRLLLQLFGKEEAVDLLGAG